MKSPRRKRILKVFLFAVVALCLGATQAAACHNGKSFRDADSDGATNRCEAQAGTDPAVADTDGDGIADGAEDSDGDGADNAAESWLWTNCGDPTSRFKIHSAKIAGYDNNVLTLTLKNGGVVAAPVSSDVKCRVKVISAGIANSGHGGKGGHRHGGHGHHHGKHHGDDNASRACTAADLTADTYVRKAKVRGGEFVKLKLVK
jgi:hypothetical protein